jgi:micrococcal nuclease
MFTYDCEVTYVVDGDTVVVDIDLGFNINLYKQKIRLYGINTESRTRDKEEKFRGLQAKARLKELLREREVRLESKEKGKYGRILGELFTKSPVSKKWNNVNQQLVKEGHAVEYYGGKR